MPAATAREGRTNLSRIEEVVVDKSAVNAPSKFIVVKLSDGDTTREFLRARNTSLHQNILEGFLEEKEVGKLGKSEEELVLGKGVSGGRMFVDTEAHVIFLWGKSDRYDGATGMYEREGFFNDVGELLRKRYPDFAVVNLMKLILDGKAGEDWSVFQWFNTRHAAERRGCYREAERVGGQDRQRGDRARG